MKRLPLLLPILLLAACASAPASTPAAPAQPKPTTHLPKEAAQGWDDLLADFPAKWRQGNCQPDTFTLVDDSETPGGKMVVCTGIPLGFIHSAKTYENFIAEFDWKHLTERPNPDQPGSNSGFFIWADAKAAPGAPWPRAIEIQVTNFGNSDWYSSHGDVFAIHGATMTPDPRFAVWARGMRSLPLEFRCNPTGQWNHYRVLAIDGVVTLEVNGKVVSGGYHARPRKGHVCLESEAGLIHFRNLRIKELPPSGTLKDGDTAAVAAE